MRIEIEEEEILANVDSDIQKLKAPQGYVYAGSPFFHKELFGRDSITVALQKVDIEPDIAKDTLAPLAEYQATTINPEADREPGKILHVLGNNSSMPGCEMPYYGSVDATPLFTVLAGEYYKVTHDAAFIREIRPNIVAAVNWMPEYGDADGDHLIKYKRRNEHGCFHQSWKDCFEDHLRIDPPVAIVEAQGYAYAAYRAGAYLAAELFKDKPLANLWLDEAEKLREAFHKAFWWEEESFYYLGLGGGKKEPRKSVTSNPGHLLFSGILDQEKAGKVVQRLFKDDIWTPYGIRTLSVNDPDFDPFSYHLGPPWIHDNWWTFYGLEKLGLTREADVVGQAAVLTYKALGCAPELHGVDKDGHIFLLTEEGGKYIVHPGPNTGYANRLQAWSSGGLGYMIRSMRRRRRN